MNNKVLEHTSSREPGIRLDISPLGDEDTAQPNLEYVVKFVVPSSASVSDVQFVLELLVGGESSSDPPPGKFTTAPPNGGIGCEGRRSHGKVGKDGESAAIFTINENAVSGTKLEIVAGWATGHEAVTLTEKVALIVGQGVVSSDAAGGGDGGAAFDDDGLQDDEAEAELEEAFIELEREDMEQEIANAEEDAVEALEEKRQETDGSWSEINEVEEEIVESLEENRKDVDQALNLLKDEIMLRQADRQKKKGDDHAHSVKERREAQRYQRFKHERNHDVEDRLEEMHRRFEKKNDIRKDKLDELMNMKGDLKENVENLQLMDKKEHERARRKHIQPLPKAELKVDMEELKQKAKEKMQLLSDKLGVHELMNEPHMKQIRGKLKGGLIRGGEGTFHGDEGRPLPPEGRHFLIVMFTFFGLVGAVRWYLEKRRKALLKGRRSV
ncbi:hypothetical protein ACHAXR_003799 [Thalassiosira sp. AJA248-18]